MPIRMAGPFLAVKLQWFSSCHCAPFGRGDEELLNRQRVSNVRNESTWWLTTRRKSTMTYKAPQKHAESLSLGHSSAL